MFTSIYFNSTSDKKALRCRCGCGANVTPHMLAALDRVRGAWGHPLLVTSGARCLAYTKKLREYGIPAALGSAHIEGLAVDVTTAPGKDIKDFQEWLITRLEGLGIWVEDFAFTKNWCHIQIRPAKNRMFKP